MNVKDFIRGWFIGNFDQALFKTTDFEISFQSAKKGEPVARHYQRISTEYNVVASGKLLVNGKTYEKGDIFVFEPYVVCEVEFLEDSDVVCVKVPSVGIEDKVLCDDKNDNL